MAEVPSSGTGQKTPTSGKVGQKKGDKAKDYNGKHNGADEIARVHSQHHGCAAISALGNLHTSIAASEYEREAMLHGRKVLLRYQLAINV